MGALTSRFLAALTGMTTLPAGIDDLALVELDARVRRGPWPWQGESTIQQLRPPRTERRSSDRAATGGEPVVVALRLRKGSTYLAKASARIVGGGGGTIGSRERA